MTRAGLAALAALAVAACAAPKPQVARYTVSRAPGESIAMGRVEIPDAVSGIRGGVEPDAVRVTIQTEGAQTVRPTPLTPAGYLLISLPPGKYRIVSWESRASRAAQFGPLDVPFEIPSPDRFYYLGTLTLDAQTTERYRLRVADQLDEAMRYLIAEHPHLAGPFERRLLTLPAATPRR